MADRSSRGPEEDQGAYSRNKQTRDELNQSFQSSARHLSSDNLYSKEALTGCLYDFIEHYSAKVVKQKRLFARAEEFLDRLNKSSLSQREKKTLINSLSPYRETSIGHILAKYNSPARLWEKAGALGYDFNLKDHKGDTPLMISIAQRHHGFRALYRVSSASGYDFREVNAEGKNLFEIAFKSRSINNANYLITYCREIKDILQKIKIRTDSEDTSDTYTNGIEAFKSVYELIQGSEANFNSELLSLISRHGNLEHALAYVNSYSSMVDRNGDFSPYAFAKFLPIIYSSYPYDQVNELLKDLEGLMDHNDVVRSKKHHPNTADMLALLSHPGNQEQDQDVLTSALTSPYGLIYSSVDNIKFSTMQVLKVIGILGMSFRQWKFEAMRPLQYLEEKGELKQKSLLEHYGLNLIASKEGRPSDFGNGYFLKAGSKDLSQNLDYFGWTDLKPDTTIVFWRGGLLVSSIDGTLFIRNSSLKFGRDLVLEPAYYHPRRFIKPSLEDHQISNVLNSINPLKLERSFKHILQANLYQNNEVKFESIKKLLAQLYLVSQDIRKWQCDMDYNTAWFSEAGEEDYIVGAYKSPGFARTVDFLFDLYMDIENEKLVHEFSNRKMPVLAWVHKAYIPWQSYAQLELGYDQLCALKTLAGPERNINLELLNASGVYDFFQKGFDFNAALMIQDTDEFIND